MTTCNHKNQKTKILFYRIPGGYIEIMGNSCEDCGVPLLTKKEKAELEDIVVSNTNLEMTECRFVGSQEY